MKFQLEISNQAQEDLLIHKKSGNKIILNKIKLLLHDTIEHPFEGIGKPEPLKHDLANKWSRRITNKHRMVYEVIDEHILVHSLHGHYL